MEAETDIRATIPMPKGLRDRIRALAKLNGRPFNKHALWMLRDATDKEERRIAAVRTAETDRSQR